jgi:hypothetical protein
VAAQQSENDRRRIPEGAKTGLAIERADAADLVLDTLVHNDAVTRGNDVLVPLDLGSIGELGDEVIAQSSKDQRRLVGLAGRAPDVPNKRERAAPTAG